jgi:hypothetical protein
MTVVVKTRDGVPIETGYGKPITVVKYVNDVVVVVTPFGTFVITPSSVAYVNGEQCAIAEIQKGEKIQFKPRDAERLKDIIRSYMPDSLPPQLTRRGSKIYLGDVEVGTVYELS